MTDASNSSRGLVVGLVLGVGVAGLIFLAYERGLEDSADGASVISEPSEPAVPGIRIPTPARPPAAAAAKASPPTVKKEPNSALKNPDSGERSVTKKAAVKPVSSPRPSGPSPWPTNTKKKRLKDPGIVPTCPGGLACPCSAASECPNGNCVTTRRNQGFCDPEKGDVFPNFRLIDQFGNPVELYDFANQGQWVIVEMAAAWCPGCNDLAAWFASGDTTVMARAKSTKPILAA